RHVRDDVRDDVVVADAVRAGARGEAARVRAHQADAVRGGDLGQPRVGPAPGVVEQVGARPRHGLADLGAPGVDADHHARVALADGGDEVEDAAQLLADADVLAGAGLDAADVDDVGAGGHGPVHGGEGRVEAVGGAPVEERVGGAVDHGHDRVRAEVAPVQPQ